MEQEWQTVEHALRYLARADTIPHRVEGESCLVRELLPGAKRILDLGSGDGRLLALALLACPEAEGVAIDFSPPMLAKLEERFGNSERVAILEHDLSQPLPKIGKFDAIISCFAIHHLEDPRKRELYAEIFELLESPGVFCNLEHVASPTARLHEAFYKALNVPLDQEDKANRLLDVETQLKWLREIGFTDVDCYWKWRELALLAGRKD